MNLVVPITITAAMIGAGTTVAEPAAGETAWTSAGTYALGDKRIRTTTHRVYQCIQAHTGRAALPEADPLYWSDVGPTQRWAPFDTYVSTAATGTSSMTYVLSPGFVNTLALYGLTGTSVSVTIKDAPGGNTIYTSTQALYEGSSGWYDYLFGRRRLINKLVLSDLPIRPTAEITITVSSGAGNPVGVGMIVLGDLVNLVGTPAAYGGTRQGASAEPVTYSYIKTDDYGTTTIVRRYWSKASAAAVAAVLIALAGYAMNRNRKAWSTRHSLFYLPMEYWSIVILVIDATITYHEMMGTNQ